MTPTDTINLCAVLLPEKAIEDLAARSREGMDASLADVCERLEKWQNDRRLTRAK